MKILNCSLFGLLAAIIIISCKKDDPSDITQTKKVGLIQKLLVDSPVFKIMTGNIYDQNIYPGASCDVCFFFKPLREIKVTSVGYKAAETGEFKILFRKIRPNLKSPEQDTLYIQSIPITNTQDFQYTDLTRELVLLKNQEYVIYCYNKSVNSVYNAVYTNPNPDPTRTSWIFPMLRGDIIIGEHYSNLYNNNYLYITSVVNSNSMRGLVDFTYQ